MEIISPCPFLTSSMRKGERWPTRPSVSTGRKSITVPTAPSMTLRKPITTTRTPFPIKSLAMTRSAASTRPFPSLLRSSSVVSVCCSMVCPAPTSPEWKRQNIRPSIARFRRRCFTCVTCWQNNSVPPRAQTKMCPGVLAFCCSKVTHCVIVSSIIKGGFSL